MEGSVAGRTGGSIARVLLVVKQSTAERVNALENHGSSRLRQLLEDEDRSVQDLRGSDAEHAASMREVRRVLKSRGLHVTERSDLPSRGVRGYDLVLAVGGDGLVLGASHAVRDSTPLLGVNSAPSFSVGFLAGCTSSTLESTLDALDAAELEPLLVQRLQLVLGDRTVAEPVLNDLLFCADNPAIMSRYLLIWPDGQEVQRSSGVWIATPAGSTSALASAGGPILPLTAKQFAFFVREPYAPPGASVRFRSAVLAEGQELGIECRTLGASVFVDGSHRRYPIGFGETMRVSLHPNPLRLLRRPR